MQPPKKSTLGSNKQIEWHMNYINILTHDMLGNKKLLSLLLLFLNISHVKTYCCCVAQKTFSRHS